VMVNRPRFQTSVLPSRVIREVVPIFVPEYLMSTGAGYSWGTRLACRNSEDVGTRAAYPTTRTFN
jgi:hypothetical protein